MGSLGSIQLTKDLRRDLVMVLNLDELPQSKPVLCPDLMLVPEKHIVLSQDVMTQPRQ